MLFEPSDRNYSETITINSTIINPIEKKLLVGDTINDDDILYTSKYRTDKKIPGILMYSGQTYGRYKDKMLFKCVPNDKKLPVFLIPYLEKKSKFNKAKINKFILFEFVEWTDKHPRASITNTLGNVNQRDIYYDYQLYCKNLHIPIQILTKKTTTELWKYDNEDVFNGDEMERRESRNVISIDPEGAVDFDDALGVSQTQDGVAVVSIYISNVVAVLEKLGIWSTISDRVSTIYLPHEKKPMLPSKLSDDVCSLIERKRRSVVAMDVYISPTGVINHIKYSNCIINVNKNYVYEEEDLKQSDEYNSLYLISRRMNNRLKYLNEIVDSHDVVAFYMLLMNINVGSYLADKKIGIFRNVTVKNELPDEMNTPELLRDFIKVYSNVNSNYGLYSDNNRHDLIGGGVKFYLQVTSPIRRMCDLVNMMLLQKYVGNIALSREATNFIDKWIGQIDLLNENMRSIRRVQNDCNMLNYCLENMDNSRIYIGFVIHYCDKYENYLVYVPEIKFTSYIKNEEKLEKFKEYKFTMHIFNDEFSLKQKVRLQLVL